QYRTGFRDGAAPVPAEARWNVPEATNPWKSSEPWTDSELQAFVAEGIEANPLRAFEPADFSADLIPATPLKLTTPRKLDPGSNGRGTRYFYTWIDQAPAEMTFDVTGGLIAHYRDRGP